MQPGAKVLTYSFALTVAGMLLTGGTFTGAVVAGSFVSRVAKSIFDAIREPPPPEEGLFSKEFTRVVTQGAVTAFIVMIAVSAITEAVGERKR
jgi:hypothetical protein